MANESYQLLDAAAGRSLVGRCRGAAFHRAVVSAAEWRDPNWFTCMTCLKFSLLQCTVGPGGRTDE
jgi:hypothetical protein